MSFIVIDDTNGTATLLSKDLEGAPKLGILLCSEEKGTEFATRVAAKRAIERTQTYLDRQTPRRLHHILRIVQLQPEALAK